MEISVIVLTYNPDIKKLNATLKSIIMQKKVDFEVIISDDGSSSNVKQIVDNVMSTYNYTKYIYTELTVNSGTVMNYYNGLKHSSGKYVYAISPGDLLYDDNVLNDFYLFCEKNRCNLCFGNAVYYKSEDRINILEDIINLPPRPIIFSNKYGINTKKSALFFGSIILGVTFFRERQSTIRYLEEIKNISKYVEDNTISFLAMCYGNNILYYDRNIAWYEFGTGISTSKKEKWNKLLNEDFDHMYEYLKEKFPKDKVVDAAYYDRFHKSKFKSLIYRAVKHPKIMIVLFFLRIIPKKKITKGDINILKSLLISPQ